jgi:histone arginine demethylase JMJD6
VETIEKRSDISYKEFIEKYQKTGTPVIIERATSAWQNGVNFDPQFFKDNFGNRTTKFGDEEYTVSRILDLTEKSTKENPSPYPVKFDILTQLPELLSYMKPLHLNFAKPNWLKAKVLKGKLTNDMDLHIGGIGNHYSVHKDTYHTHAWLIQLYGEKEVIIFPKGQEAFLYPGKEGLSRSRSPIDISNPDYEKYPKFREATPIRATIKAGDVMYIPSGIWHTTMAYGQNISTIVDQMNGSNFKAWLSDIYTYKAYHSKPRAVLDVIAGILIGGACKIGQTFGVKFE